MFLGSDEWGDWVGQAVGWRSTRPGRTFTVTVPNVTLIPPTGDYAYTRNPPPATTRVYIDIGWDVGWQDALPRGIDMDLDVVSRDRGGPYWDRIGVLRQPGEVWIEDRDEWDEHRVALGYPLGVVEHLEQVAVDLERRVRAGEGAFNEAVANAWLARIAQYGGPWADSTPPA